MTTVSIIVAVSENNVIGINNEIPWYIPEDFKHFKSVTMGKPCIMGRKTYESILAKLGKALPGRQSIVISRSNYQHDDAMTVDSLDAAIETAKGIAKTNNMNEIMIIGGAQIYEQALPLTNRLYLTRVHERYDGDVFFPEITESDWEKAVWDDHGEYSFVTYEKT